MPELPDPRSVSPESLHLWRLLAVRAVVDFEMSQAVYLRYADKYIGPLASRLIGVNQPVIMTQNRFSTPRPRLLADI